MDLQAILDEIARRCRAADRPGPGRRLHPRTRRALIRRTSAWRWRCPTGGCCTAAMHSCRFPSRRISKVFTLAIALGRLGDQLWHRVGREPSGLAFNSILQLENEKGVPRNPFVNAGAIVVTDAILAGHAPREVLGEVLRFIRAAAGDDDIHINDAVAASEAATGHRNLSLAHFMRAERNLLNPPELTLGTYFHQCAVEMTCEQLARAGRFLMDAPRAARMVSPARVRRINALMMTCGHYDGSGEFAYRVGLPGKSRRWRRHSGDRAGRASIAVWSPGLNAQGNSKLGTEAVERSRPPHRLVDLWLISSPGSSVHPAPVPPSRQMPKTQPDTARVLPVSCHLRIVGLVAVGRPDLAVAISAVALGDHVPDDLLADIGRWRSRLPALVECLDQRAAEGRAAGRDLHIAEMAVVIGLGLPRCPRPDRQGPHPPLSSSGGRQYQISSC